MKHQGPSHYHAAEAAKSLAAYSQTIAVDHVRRDLTKPWVEPLNRAAEHLAVAFTLDPDLREAVDRALQSQTEEG